MRKVPSNRRFFRIGRKVSCGIYNGVGNPQLMEIPIIKGRSGCGKTRLVIELAEHGLNYVKCIGKEAISAFIQMTKHLCLDSSYFRWEYQSRVQRVDHVGYISAILLFVLLQDEGIPPLRTIMCFMKGYADFTTEELSKRLQQVLDVGMLFLHVDEYRDDLPKTNALLRYCSQALFWSGSESPNRHRYDKLWSPNNSMAMFTGPSLPYYIYKCYPKGDGQIISWVAQVFWCCVWTRETIFADSYLCCSSTRRFSHRAAHGERSHSHWGMTEFTPFPEWYWWDILVSMSSHYSYRDKTGWLFLTQRCVLRICKSFAWQ